MKYNTSKSCPVPSELDIIQALERGKSVVSVLLEHGVSAITPEPVGAIEQATASKREPATKDKSKVTTSSSNSAPRHTQSKRKKKKKRRVVDRRRRKPGDEDSGEDSDHSASDGDSSLSSSESLDRLSSDEDLALENLGEDDLELLDSLSESSSSGPEEEGEGEEVISSYNTTPSSDAKSTGSPLTPPAAAPTRRARRKHIVLAANFNMPPKTPPHSSPQPVSKQDHTSAKETGENSGRLPLPTRSPGPLQRAVADQQLVELVEDTAHQSAVYTACRLLAEESSLMAVKVFTYWLHSCPIIIATCTQVHDLV